MSNKCCYFIRNVPNGVVLDLTKTGDNDLLFGELGSSPLGTIEAILSQSYRPLIDVYDNWGKVDEEQKSDFINEVGAFITNINEALSSFSNGLELRSPDPKYLRTLDAGRKPPVDAIDHFEGLLTEWCNQIERYLAQPAQNVDSEDVGPRGELEYWRSRMQRLTSITEQLKRPDCKMVIVAINGVKNPSEVSKQNTANLLNRWRTLDRNITEAANEAKDNVKYLYTLERFIDPLYTGNAETIIDTLPALMNSIKMIHTIARYYNTPERMTKLFEKITDQMIVNCKMHISSASESDSLWDCDPPDLIRKLESCIRLNAEYQEQYRLTKQKLEQAPKGKQFSFNHMNIFGKFDLFCRRVSKLIDMFQTIDQFNKISRNKLEGMDSLVDRFHQIVKDLRLKRHDLLDIHNSRFDRDYIEFNKNVSCAKAIIKQSASFTDNDICLYRFLIWMALCKHSSTRVLRTLRPLSSL